MGSFKYMDNIPHMLYKEETFVCPFNRKDGEVFSYHAHEIVPTSLDVLGDSTSLSMWKPSG